MKTHAGVTRCGAMLQKYPALLLPLFMVVGGVTYGGLMSALMFFSTADGDSMSWAALLFGFIGLLVVPSSLEQSLGKMSYVSLLCIAQGAFLGGMAGWIGYLCSSTMEFRKSDGPQDS